MWPPPTGWVGGGCGSLIQRQQDVTPSFSCVRWVGVLLLQWSMMLLLILLYSIDNWDANSIEEFLTEKL